ncbi:Transmembrane BAX inhibitor motif containing 1 [Fasciola gigantica]|uniref:Transmembrane BAX inhibitor motif containing 1 n=1 Tax=Fasciola gigantica TaxID=46835 RepID=A0A504YZN4_FASGI|nr:Transmembrane BAX inhibitor motif containing 1 [Fasciola gigantica]
MQGNNAKRSLISSIFLSINYTVILQTLALSYMTGCITAFHDTYIVLIALACTVALCLAITVFAIQTRYDFTMCSGLIFAVSMVAFLTGIACIIVNFTLGRNRILQAVYAGIVLLLFSLLLVYHTQQIVGGRKHDLDEEEYVFGALQLYVDVVFIFSAMIGIAGST